MHAKHSAKDINKLTSCVASWGPRIDPNAAFTWDTASGGRKTAPIIELRSDVIVFIVMICHKPSWLCPRRNRIKTITLRNTYGKNE